MSDTLPRPIPKPGPPKTRLAAPALSARAAAIAAQLDVLDPEKIGAGKYTTEAREIAAMLDAGPVTLEVFAQYWGFRFAPAPRSTHNQLANLLQRLAVA